MGHVHGEILITKIGYFNIKEYLTTIGADRSGSVIENFW